MRKHHSWKERLICNTQGSLFAFVLLHFLLSYDQYFMGLFLKFDLEEKVVNDMGLIWIRLILGYLFRCI